MIKSQLIKTPNNLNSSVTKTSLSSTLIEEGRFRLFECLAVTIMKNVSDQLMSILLPEHQSRRGLSHKL